MSPRHFHKQHGGRLEEGVDRSDFPVFNYFSIIRGRFKANTSTSVRDLLPLELRG